MTAAIPEMAERLIIDGTKVGWYPDRIAAWQRGEKIAPITVDCAMTRACNAACNFCVWPDTPVLMDDGTERPITEINEGDVIASVDLHGRISNSVVKSRWQTSPRMNGLQLRLASGKVLKCTTDHLILTEFGWMPAGSLRNGDYVYEFSSSQSSERKNEAKQPDEASWRGGEGHEDETGTSRSGFLHEALAENRRRGQERQAYSVREREGGHQCSYDREQSNEAGQRRREKETLVYAGVQAESFGVHEEDMAGREDYPGHVSWTGQRQGSEQDGAAPVSDIDADARSLCGRRDILAQGDGERDQQEPGFHIRKWQEENSPTSARRILASGQGQGESGNPRLSQGGLESIRVVDEANQFMDASGNRVGDPGMAGRSQVVAIEDAGSSPVYDLECSPHHNFIAGGIVVHNCYAQTQASEGAKITKERFFYFLDDAAEIGVKGVSFISDGESTVVPWYADAVEHACNLGLQVGAGSNGIKLTRPVLERVLPCLSYLRFNFSAGERKRYAEIMGVAQPMYDVVVQNITDAMDIVNRDGLSVTVNMQLVCDPKDSDQLIPFAELACRLRPTYAVVKHCADDAEGTLGVDYSKYAALESTFDQIEAMGREAGVRIEVKRGRLDGKRKYTRCFGPPFITQISGNGTCAPCGFLFNEKYKAFHFGSIVTERYKDIWASDRYWEVMRYLASEHFDPSKRCGPNCLQHNTNDFLFRYVNGQVELPTVLAPPHIGFL